ncbi:MAG: helix-turn-helix transcriptional regulator [Bacillota bacterium]|nr:helix-turn-helix transcriptional regulator [Bacillota bacterium]
MQTCDVLRSERELRRLTQEALARRVFVHVSTIKGYEAGVRAVPDEVAGRLAQALKSPRLAVTHCHNCPANLFIPPYLDQVDVHPLAALSAVMDEAREAVAAVEGLHLRNKLRDADLSPDDRQALERAVDQMLDLLPAVITTVAALGESYGVDPWAATRRNHEKLRRRGYTGEPIAEGSAA